MSKLAALAARRRQKENDNNTSSTNEKGLQQNDYTAQLSKLTLTRRKSKERRAREINTQVDEGDARADGHVSLSDASKEVKHDNKSHDNEPTVSRNPPSAFANAIFNSVPQSPCSLKTIDTPLSINRAGTFDFKKPSPDDVVQNAQNMKS